MNRSINSTTTTDADLALLATEQVDRSPTTNVITEFSGRRLLQRLFSRLATKELVRTRDLLESVRRRLKVEKLEPLMLLAGDTGFEFANLTQSQQDAVEAIYDTPWFN